MIQLRRFTRFRTAVQGAVMVLLAAAGLFAAAAQDQPQLRDPSYCDASPGWGGEPGRDAPALTGTLAEARRTLRPYRVQIEVVLVAYDEPAGRVVNQWPKPGEPIFEQRVRLCVSSGPDPGLTMPSLIGMTIEQARQVLGERDLPTEPDIRTAQHPSAARGTIYGQSPEAGAPIFRNLLSGIILDVSDGPPPAATPLMPSLIDRTVDEARQLLADRQIANQPEIRRAPHPAAAPGTIFAQSPVAGAPLAAAAAIVLDVSEGPPPAQPQWVVVPQLQGMPEAEAVARLERAGLIAVAGGARRSPRAAGEVIETRPAAGERVEPGAPIYYAVSLGPDLPPALETEPPDNGWLLAAILAAAALAAAAVLARLVRPPLPKLEVRVPGPPVASIDWGEPPGLEFEVSAEPPAFACEVEAADLPGGEKEE